MVQVYKNIKNQEVKQKKLTSAVEFTKVISQTTLTKCLIRISCGSWGIAGIITRF